jgi:hypothetical protein
MAIGSKMSLVANTNRRDLSNSPSKRGDNMDLYDLNIDIDKRGPMPQEYYKVLFSKKKESLRDSTATQETLKN